jgi:hypothetical protein
MATSSSGTLVYPGRIAGQPSPRAPPSPPKTPTILFHTHTTAETNPARTCDEQPFADVQIEAPTSYQKLPI